jgi:hypothetical protein
MVFGMLALFSVIPLPFIHISFDILFSFMPTYVPTKRISLSNKDFILPFHFTIDVTLDNV